MPLIQIRAFDPHTAGPELWRSFHECRRALSAELDPDDPVLSDAETEIEMRRADPFHDCLRWLAHSEGGVIGFASAFFRKPGTPDAAEHAPFLFARGRVRAEARHRLCRLDHRLLGIAPRTVRVLLAGKIGFEDRLQHQHRCCHQDPVPQG